MSGIYEVLNPWAEADPVPFRGLTPRINTLAGKKIGLFTLTYKHASARVNSVIERRLKEKYPDAVFSYFNRNYGADFDDTTNHLSQGQDTKETLASFEDWVKGVDAVVGAVGD
jgi:hypothetical protein